MKYSKLIILFMFLHFFLFCKKENEIKTLQTDEKLKMLNEIKEKICINTQPLDSIIEYDKGNKLFEKSFMNIDSIKLFEGLLNIFDTSGLKEVKFKYFESEKINIESNTPIKFDLPGRINQLIFDSNDSARKSYLIFVDDLLNHKIEGKINVKAGGLCFIDNNVIFLLPIKSCGDSDKLNQISLFLKEKVFIKNSEGVKFYCSLNEIVFIK